MTYPPNQGPYGQQPGGWGPQQPPQQPPPPPPPGYDQTQQWNYPGGFQEDEPPKKRTGLIVGIVAAVLVIVAAVGVTGFWKPGFFLAADEGDDGGTDNPTSSAPQVPGSTGPSTGGPPPKPSIQTPGPATSGQVTPPGGGGPVDASDVASVAQATVDAFNARDNQAFKEQFCNPSDAESAQLEKMPPEAKMTITGEPKITGDKAKVPVEMTIGQGEPMTEEMPLENQSGRWCVTNE